jgi:hypothetical protein
MAYSDGMTTPPIPGQQSLEGDEVSTQVSADAPPVEPKRVGRPPVEAICDECGEDFTGKPPSGPAALGLHKKRAHGTPGAKGPQPSTATRVTSDSPRISPHIASKQARKSGRVDRWTMAIYRDVNPALVKGVSTVAQIPPEWLDAKNVPVIMQTPDGPAVVHMWQPTLRSRLTLDRDQSKAIAKGLAEFAETPTGMLLVTWFEAHAGIITLAGALWVAGKYGWSVMALRTEVAAVKGQMAEQVQAETQAAVQADPTPPGPFGPPGAPMGDMEIPADYVDGFDPSQLSPEALARAAAFMQANTRPRG